MPDFIKSLCHVEKHCTAELSLFQSSIGFVKHRQRLVNCRILTTESKLESWNQVAFFDEGLKFVEKEFLE